jgi:hypothetical protein
LGRYDTQGALKAAYADSRALPPLPDGVTVTREDDGSFLLSYDKRELPTDQLLALLQKEGVLSELMVREQNLDTLIAAMYREMAL